MVEMDDLVREAYAVERGLEASWLVAKIHRMHLETIVKEAASASKTGEPQTSSPMQPVEVQDASCGCPPKWLAIVRGTTKTRCTNPDCPGPKKGVVDDKAV